MTRHWAILTAEPVMLDDIVQALAPRLQGYALESDEAGAFNILRDADNRAAAWLSPTFRMADGERQRLFPAHAEHTGLAFWTGVALRSEEGTVELGDFVAEALAQQTNGVVHRPEPAFLAPSPARPDQPMPPASTQDPKSQQPTTPGGPPMTDSFEAQMKTAQLCQEMVSTLLDANPDLANDGWDQVAEFVAAPDTGIQVSPRAYRFESSGGITPMPTDDRQDAELAARLQGATDQQWASLVIRLTAATQKVKFRFLDSAETNALLSPGPDGFAERMRDLGD